MSHLNAKHNSEDTVFVYEVVALGGQDEDLGYHACVGETKYDSLLLQPNP